MSFELSIDKMAHIGISIDQFLYSVAMLQTVFYLSLIVKSISVQDDCIAYLLAIQKITHKLIILFVNLLSESAWLSFRPFSIIAHKTILIGLINMNDLDGSFSMPHAIFKVSKVKVLFRHIFEAKAVLITLAWQVSLPLSKIESTVEIPDYVLIGLQLQVNSVFEAAHD